MPYVRKLGRNPRLFRQSVPHYSSMRLMRTSPAAPIPDAVNYLQGMPEDLGMLMNDLLGDCTCAGIIHFLAVLRFNAAHAYAAPSNADVLKLYELACGYVDGDSSTDKGALEQSVLAYCMNTGVPLGDDLHKIMGYAEIDVRNMDDVCRVIAEGGGIYLGIQCPETWTQQAPGSTFELDRGPIAGGHCVTAHGYDKATGLLDIVTWGGHFTMTFDAFQEVVSEGYMIMDLDWFMTNNLTPFGLNLGQMENFMASEKAMTA
jgi:hypothetical protein